MEKKPGSSQKAEQARALFESGCNCAQSVAGSFYQEMGLSQETALLLASPFGGGISRLRETCGAVTGMMMVLGLTHGYQPFTDEDTHLREKTRVYRTGQELIEQFRREYGTLLCRELLRDEGTDSSPTPSARTEQYYHSRPCAQIIAFAAALLESYLRENGKTGDEHING